MANEQIVTPAQYLIGQEGVALIDNESHGLRLILGIPLWCSNKSDVSITFEWVTGAGEHRKSILLLDDLKDSRQMDKWLLSRSIVAFLPTRKGLKAVKQYLSACVEMHDNDFVADKVDLAKTAPQAISTLAAGFINANSEQVTELLIDRQCWTIANGGGQSSCLGRVQHERTTNYSYTPNWSLAVRARAFKNYAATFGFADRELRRLMHLSKVRGRRLTLFPGAITTHVWVIPLLDHDYTQRGTDVVPYGVDRQQDTLEINCE